MVRKSELKRTTKETIISLSLNLDGTGQSEIDTKIGFFDHMLTLFSAHSHFDLRLTAEGDISVDNHHTVEDIGICLGSALLEALGDKRGIERYGFSYVPMDEALVRSVVDFSGRSYLIYEADVTSERIGAFETETLREFFLAFSSNAKMNLHITKLAGINSHHIVEAVFKSVGRAMKIASSITGDQIPSTKGIL
jgi:imidazoleglycerol-phosphate dehydratase